MMRDQGGAAATLAVFTVFVILCAVVALHTFEVSYQRQLSMLQQRMATDTTKATAAAVEAELNDALRTAIGAGMYEAGRRGENREKVEERIRTYINQRIKLGWSYSNFENIHVPLSDENSLLLEWLPDGGLRAYGYLNATFTHLMGAKAYGVKLDAGIVPRYERMYYIAHRVWSQAQTMSRKDIDNFKDELNKNYACERLRFELENMDSRVRVTVYELYGGRAIAAENAEFK